MSEKVIEIGSKKKKTTSPGEKLTIDQRIKNLADQRDQAKEIFLKCDGAIQVLQELKKDM